MRRRDREGETVIAEQTEAYEMRLLARAHRVLTSDVGWIEDSDGFTLMIVQLRGTIRTITTTVRVA